jgi:hypothetical protein
MIQRRIKREKRQALSSPATRPGVSGHPTSAATAAVQTIGATTAPTT